MESPRRPRALNSDAAKLIFQSCTSVELIKNPRMGLAGALVVWF